MTGKQCYIFDNEQTAINAEAFISGLYGFPRKGKNAKSKKDADDSKQKTIRWAIPQQRVNDNKWFFEQVPPSLGGKFGVLNGQKFNNDYPHTVDVCQENWLPNEIE